MTFQLKRVEPLRAANIGALVYGLFLAVFTAILLPIFLIVTPFAPTEPGAPPMFLFSFLLLFYPIFGLVFGWLSGLLMSVIYNFVVRWSGGLLFEMDGPAAA